MKCSALLNSAASIVTASIASVSLFGSTDRKLQGETPTSLPFRKKPYSQPDFERDYYIYLSYS